jgi:glutathione S-transferase
MGLVLTIGNQNYSSWSLRPWLALEHTGAPYESIVIPLYRADSPGRISARSPSGRVPVLDHDGLVIWDSLAICEYLAEAFPDAHLWPSDRAARAHARSVSAEMHSSFSALRTNMGMNIRARLPGYGRTPDSLRDIERVRAIWTGCRSRFGAGGPYLFDAFSIADAMFAPVVLRFRTYAVELDAVARAYSDAMLERPALKKWIQAAEAEDIIIDQFEYPPIRA